MKSEGPIKQPAFLKELLPFLPVKVEKRLTHEVNVDPVEAVNCSLQR